MIIKELQNKDTACWKGYIEEKQYSKHFWKTDTVTDESVQVIKENDTVLADLLLRSKDIIGKDGKS